MDVSVFATSKWAAASYSERLEALQGLENFFAEVQGRTPRSVKDKNLDKGVMGRYIPRNPADILIDEKLVRDDSSNFLAMDTIIHEGRHAYQDDCIMWLCTPIPADIPCIGGWRENMPGRGGKYFGGGLAYRYQPVEADAYRYASEQMDAYMSYFGEDPNYIAYRIQREAGDDEQEKKANSALGENFVEIIAHEVRKKYLVLCMAVSGIHIASDDYFISNGGHIMGISTFELVAKIKGLQNSSEQLSVVIANASQELVRQANYLAQLTRGSRSGGEATGVVRASSKSLHNAAIMLRSLCQAGDEYIQNAVK